MANMYNKFDFVEACVAIAISVTAMIMACIYHFHEYGFFLGFIGCVIASIWMFVMVKDNIKKRRLARRQGRYRDSDAEVEMRNNSRANNRDSSLNMQDEESQECNFQDKLEEYGCGLGCCIYITYLLTVITYIIVRVLVFQAHKDWRDSIHTFPEECSWWTQLSEQGGCTRLMLEEAKCVRAEKIREESELVFDVSGNDEILAEAV